MQTRPDWAAMIDGCSQQRKRKQWPIHCPDFSSLHGNKTHFTVSHQSGPDVFGLESAEWTLKCVGPVWAPQQLCPLAGKALSQTGRSFSLQNLLILREKMNSYNEIQMKCNAIKLFYYENETGELSFHSNGLSLNNFINCFTNDYLSCLFSHFGVSYL